MSTLIDVIHGRLTPNEMKLAPILSNRANFSSCAGYVSPTPMDTSMRGSPLLQDPQVAVTPINL